MTRGTAARRLETPRSGRHDNVARQPAAFPTDRTCDCGGAGNLGIAASDADGVGILSLPRPRESGGERTRGGCYFGGGGYPRGLADFAPEMPIHRHPTGPWGLDSSDSPRRPDGGLRGLRDPPRCSAWQKVFAGEGVRAEWQERRKTPVCLHRTAATALGSRCQSGSRHRCPERRASLRLPLTTLRAPVETAPRAAMLESGPWSPSMDAKAISRSRGRAEHCPSDGLAA